MKNFRTCDRGVAAIETALLLAAFVPCAISGLALVQKVFLSQAVQFASFASASAGSRALASGGSAETAAQNVFAANLPRIFFGDVTASINVAVSGSPPTQTVTVTVSASEPLFIPIGSFAAISSQVIATD